MALEIVRTAMLHEPTSTTLDLSTDIFVQVADDSAVQTVRVLGLLRGRGDRVRR